MTTRGTKARADRPARILHTVQNLCVPEDPRVWKEARDLAAAGYDVHVVCPRAAGRARREVLERVHIVRYRAARVDGNIGRVLETAIALWWTTLHALRLQRRGGLAVLHSANPPDAFFLVALLLRPFGTRFVYDQHDVCPELLLVKFGERPLFARVLRACERWSYRTADLVVAPNESYRRRALAAGRRRHAEVVVVRSGPDEVHPGPHPSRLGPPVVVYAGAMDSQDGTELLLDAAAKILARRPGAFVLELIGAGDAVGALQQRSIELGIASSISWTGWLTGNAFHARLRGAAIAVSADDDTPFTRLSTMTKVTDYLGNGLPCIVADLPENRATADGAALYYPAGDAAALAGRLEKVLDDDGLREQLARAAAERAEHVRWAHSRQRLLDGYASLLRAASTSKRAPRAATGAAA